MKKRNICVTGILAMLTLVSPVLAQSAPFFWDQQISWMLTDIFGSPALIGVFSLLTIYLIGLGFRLTLEIQILVMFIFSMIFMSFYIPWWSIIAFMAAGLFIGIFLFYVLFNR